jgi:hypothetical protein
MSHAEGAEGAEVRRKRIPLLGHLTAELVCYRLDT